MGAVAAVARTPRTPSIRSRCSRHRSPQLTPQASIRLTRAGGGAALRRADRRTHARRDGRQGHRVARFRRAAERVGAQRRGDHSGQRSGAEERVRRDRRAQRSRRHSAARRSITDSLKAFNDARNKMLLANNMIALTPGAAGDDPRQHGQHPEALSRSARLDSINNGADDDGSGSMGVLEIAEAIQSMKVKPKRSMLFVWHTGEEAGLVGLAILHRESHRADGLGRRADQHRHDRPRPRRKTFPAAARLPRRRRIVLRLEGPGRDRAGVNKKQAKPLTLDYRYDTTLTGPATTTSTAAAITTTTRCKACRSRSSSRDCTATTTSAATSRSSSTIRTTRGSRTTSATSWSKSRTVRARE